MAEDSPVQGLCEETTCSVCLEYFKDPVTIDCGHNFCRACLTQCWEKTDRAPSCPQCRETVQQQNLRPNRQLASIVEIAKKLSLHRIKGAEALGPVCGRHQEPLKLFCQDDQTPICVVCDKSKEHRGHQVIPKEEAFEAYQVKVQEYLAFLKEETVAIWTSLQSGKAEGQTLLEQTERERQKIVAEFKQLHQFLEAQEGNLLAKLKNLDDRIKEERNAHAEELSKKISAVTLLIKEMEEKRKQPANEFLQDIGNILQRCNKEKFVSPDAFPHELKQRIENFCRIHPFLETTMNKFKAESQETDLDKYTLQNDLEAENLEAPTLVLSPNCLPQLTAFVARLQGSHYSTIPPRLPRFQNYSFPNPNQFSCSSYVMGVERINSGSCSWIMYVKDEKFWAVGVALEHFRGKEVFWSNPGQGIWAVGKSSGAWYTFPSPGTHCLTYPCSPGSACDIRVSLNYEQGSVTFVNTVNNRVIYAFHNASFSGQPISSWFFVAK